MEVFAAKCVRDCQHVDPVDGSLCGYNVGVFKALLMFQRKLCLCGHGYKCICLEQLDCVGNRNIHLWL